jgi:hypothetical protein
MISEEAAVTAVAVKALTRVAVLAVSLQNA